MWKYVGALKRWQALKKPIKSQILVRSFNFIAYIDYFYIYMIINFKILEVYKENYLKKNKSYLK